MILDERLFFAVGVALCLVAALFGFGLTVSAAGAAAGLAIAGGLCFLAASLFRRGHALGQTGEGAASRPEGADAGRRP